MNKLKSILVISLIGFLITVQGKEEKEQEKKEHTEEFNKRKLECRIIMKKSKKKSGTDYDNRYDCFKHSVSFENEHRYLKLENFKFRLLIFGQCVFNKTLYKIIDVVEQQFSIEARGKYRSEETYLLNEYDNNASAQFGAKYKGYLLLVWNTDNEQIFIKDKSASFIEKDFEKTLKWKKNQWFNNKIKGVNNPGFR